MNRLSKIFFIAIVMLSMALSGCTSKAAWTRPADKMVMVYVSAGKFTMGKTAKDALAACSKFENDCAPLIDWSDEQPPHTVYLDAFRIDKTDVTNAMYAKCVSAGACQKPLSSSSAMRSSYFGNPQYNNYPVINVNWDMAQAYCKWAGVRLPTEAEFEKTAIGTDGRTYPWGNQLPTCSLTNFGTVPGAGDCVSDTSAVDSYPSGTSPYGALDMDGNVIDWVSDWYSPTYYASSPASNPTGPTSGSSNPPLGPSTGQSHVLRGAYWDEEGGALFSSNRNWYDPQAINLDAIGFRCAVSAP
jgi:serine/threonine-protein kinase